MAWMYVKLVYLKRRMKHSFSLFLVSILLNIYSVSRNLGTILIKSLFQYQAIIVKTTIIQVVDLL